MPVDFDIIIVGSGPSGVSAAFPLVKTGLSILMVDGGKQPTVKIPSDEHLLSRSKDLEQWKWMVGEDYYALKNLTSVSPKLRAPTNKYVFDEFKSINKVRTNNFVAVGSLATGGLSNAWGCGVASLSEDEFFEYPFNLSDIKESYKAVSKRIGISGCQNDDLSDYFGLDQWAQPPIQMDQLHTHIYHKYMKRKNKRTENDFNLGRARLAVLSENLVKRKSCNLSGNCLWGCEKKSMYSSTYEVEHLKKYKNFKHKSGFIVENIRHNDNYISVEGLDKSNQCNTTISARRVLLAAGTLATTRFAFKMLNHKQAVPLLSTPTAAFLLWLPRFFGIKRLPAFGLGQLSFSSSLKNGTGIFGSTFNTNGIPTSEFIRHLPLNKRSGIDFLRSFLSSCIVGNVFLPGNLSSTKVILKPNDFLMVNGGYKDQVLTLMDEIVSKLRKEYWYLGALLLPKSFTLGTPGGDIHYAGTLPMRKTRINLNDTNLLGELNGLDGIHIIDGACLTTLTEKSHTLTIMANADRIAKILAVKMTKNADKLLNKI